MLHKEQIEHVQGMSDQEIYNTIDIIDLRKKEGVIATGDKPVAPGYKQYLDLLTSELKKRGLPIR